MQSDQTVLGTQMVKKKKIPKKITLRNINGRQPKINNMIWVDFVFSMGISILL